MKVKTVAAAREGFTNLDAENPRLLGSVCSTCGTYYFPAQNYFCQNPVCDSDKFQNVELSSRGRIWSFTSAGYPPPPPFVVTQEPYQPVLLAAVELAKEKMTVLGQMVDGVRVQDLKIGDEVELVLDTLYEDDEHRYLVWKWKPLGFDIPQEAQK